MEGRPPPPAGWFPDPDGRGLRWWDGERWTEHLAGLQPAPPRSGGAGWKIALVIALVFAAGIAGCAMLVSTGVHEVKRQLDQHAITAQQFRSVREGSSRGALVEELGVDPIANTSLDNEGVPSYQQYKSCVYYSRKGATLGFFEFCFKKDKLVAKRSF